MQRLDFFVTAALALALAPPAAQGQQAGAFGSANPAPETIVVTATREPTQAQALPAEVDIIDVDAARNAGIITLAETLRAAPGLDLVINGGAGQPASIFAGGANSNHTLVLYDGLRINDPASPAGAFDAGEDTNADLARIEVVQGPMSAIYGSDAIGGVVNLIPRHGGPGPFNARLDLGAGSFGVLSGAVGIDGALARFRYALTGEVFGADGFDLIPKRMSTYTGEKDGAAMATTTGVFDFAASDALSVDLLWRQRRAQADYDGDALTGNRVEDNTLKISRNDLSLGRFGVTWSIAEGLSLRATYGGMRQQRVSRDFGVDTDIYDGARRFGDATLSWRSGEAFSVVAGATDEREEVNIAEGFGIAPPFVFTQAHETNAGAFVTAQGRFDRLTLTAAVRSDHYEAFGAHATWRLGASYALFDNLRIYSAYGTAFRAPTLYERFSASGNPNLDPERSSSWEAGADAHFSLFAQARGLELGALYRHSDIGDLIGFSSTPPFAYINVGRAKIQTAELRAAVRPLAWLRARAAYVYTDAANAITGAPLLRRPKDYWTAELEAAEGPLRADLSWREVGDRQDVLYDSAGVFTGVGTAPRYGLLRLSLGYALSERAQIYIAGENLAGKTYEPANGYAGQPLSVTLGVRLLSNVAG